MVNISGLTYKELVALKEEIDSSLESKRREEERAAKAKLAEQARALGFSLSDLFGGKIGKRVYKPAAVLFRNPANPDETWTGRGRTPTWMVKALRKGGSKDQFRV